MLGVRKQLIIPQRNENVVVKKRPRKGRNLYCARNMPIESKPGTRLILGLSVGRECENKNQPRVQPVIFTPVRAPLAKTKLAI